MSFHSRRCGHIVSDLDSVFVEINIFSLSEINAFCTRNIEEQHIVPNIISDKYSDRYRHCTRYYQKTNLNLFRLSFSLFSCIRFREIRNTDISSRDQVFFFFPGSTLLSSETRQREGAVHDSAHKGSKL